MPGILVYLSHKTIKLSYSLEFRRLENSPELASVLFFYLFIYLELGRLWSILWLAWLLFTVKVGHRLDLLKFIKKKKMLGKDLEQKEGEQK